MSGELDASKLIEPKKRHLPLSDADRNLVALAKEGNLEAFDRLVSLHQERIFNLAYRMLGNREDAADIQQETFLQAWKNLRGFRGEAAFSTWLHRIAVRLCISRKRRKYPVQVQDWNEEILRPLAEPCPAACLEKAETASIVRIVLDSMPPNHRALIVLRDMEDRLAALALTGSVLVYFRAGNQVQRVEKHAIIQTTPAPKSPESSPQVMVKNKDEVEAVASGVSDKPAENVSSSKLSTRQTKMESGKAVKRSVTTPEQSKRIRTVHNGSDVFPKTKTTEVTDTKALSEEPHLPENASIAIVLDIEERNPEDDFFSYTVTDIEAGTTYTCSGRREGDTINVYAEQILEKEQLEKKG